MQVPRVRIFSSADDLAYTRVAYSRCHAFSRESPQPKWHHNRTTLFWSGFLAHLVPFQYICGTIPTLCPAHRLALFVLYVPPFPFYPPRIAKVNSLFKLETEINGIFPAAWHTLEKGMTKVIRVGLGCVGQPRQPKPYW